MPPPKPRDHLRSSAARLEERQDRCSEWGQEQNAALVRGKKLQQFIDRFKSGQANKALLEDIRKYLSVEATKKAEREAAAQKKGRQAAKKPVQAKRGPIAVGSTVRLKEGRQRG